MARTSQQIFDQVVSQAIPAQSFESLQVALKMFGLDADEFVGQIGGALEGVLDLDEVMPYVDRVVRVVGAAISALQTADTAGKIKDALPGFRAVESDMDRIRAQMLSILKDEVAGSVTDSSFLVQSGGRKVIDLAMQSHYAVKLGQFERLVIQARKKYNPRHRSETNKGQVLRWLQDRIPAEIVRGQRMRPAKSRPYAAAAILDIELRNLESWQWLSPVLNILASLFESIPVLAPMGEYLRMAAELSEEGTEMTVEGIMDQIRRFRADVERQMEAAQRGRGRGRGRGQGVGGGRGSGRGRGRGKGLEPVEAAGLGLLAWLLL